MFLGSRGDSANDSAIKQGGGGGAEAAGYEVVMPRKQQKFFNQIIKA